MRTSSGEAGRRILRVTWAAASGSAQPPQPRAHFLRATSPVAVTVPRSWPRSTSTITAWSRASGSADGQRKYSFRFPLNRTSYTVLISLLDERADGEVLLLAALQQLVDLDLAELADVAGERLAQRGGRGVGVGVRAARRLGDDLVDHPQVHLVLGGELEGVGGALALARVLPEDGGAALRRDHGIDRILEHEHAVGEADGQRAARASLADHGGDRGRAQGGHLNQVGRDGRGLAALLGAEPRMRAGDVDQRDHRRAEFLGELHQAQRLAIPLGVRHAEIAAQ